VAMGAVIVASLVLAIVVLFGVVRPWQLADPDPSDMPVAVH
jgi:DHA1 family bicyclomycin/chloramphenicol resistance-like MFS transporter